jgi:hypothetical protein
MALRWNFESALIALGKEFGRRGMMGHLALLRRFWRNRSAAAQPLRRDDWSWETVIEWLCMLRIPPLDRVYPLHQRASSICPNCEVISDRDTPAARIVRTWPGGSMMECRRCAACWLTDSAWEAEKSGLTARR